MSTKGQLREDYCIPRCPLNPLFLPKMYFVYICENPSKEKNQIRTVKLHIFSPFNFHVVNRIYVYLLPSLD